MTVLQSPAVRAAAALRFAIIAAVLVVCASVIWAGCQNFLKVLRHTLIDGIRDEEMRSEMIPAVAALKNHTGNSALAYVYDATDPTGRSVRELAFPSTVIFTSETAIGSDCLKHMRDLYRIRYVVAVKQFSTPCVARWTRVAEATDKIPALWVGELL